MVSTAVVKLWNVRVGAIAWDNERRLGSFEYEPSFVGRGWEVAPMKMPVIGSAGKIFSFIENRDTQTFKGMPGLIADALPDKYGNALINVWLSRNGRAAESLNPVEQLCFIGKRAMGALEFEPVISPVQGNAEKIEIDSLVEIAQQVLSGRQEFNTSLSSNEEKALIDILKIGTSAGGARAKAVITFNPRTKEVRSGQANADRGFSHWIIKFDGVNDQELGHTSGYGRVEMAYYHMAKDAGIEMMECMLLEENDRAHFMTKRFDRTSNQKKLHVQSFCAMMHYDFNNITSYSYEQLFATMRSLFLPYPQAEQLFRRMVFNVVSRNCDDHTKNFAFVMEETGEWKLAPAFDVCHAYRPGSIWVSQHSLSINGKRNNIRRDDLSSVATSMNIKKADKIIDEIVDVVSRWKDYAAKTGVSDKLNSAIDKTLVLL